MPGDRYRRMGHAWGRDRPSREAIRQSSGGPHVTDPREGPEKNGERAAEKAIPDSGSPRVHLCSPFLFLLLLLFLLRVLRCVYRDRQREGLTGIAIERVLACHCKAGSFFPFEAREIATISSRKEDVCSGQPWPPSQWARRKWHGTK